MPTKARITTENKPLKKKIASAVSMTMLVLAIVMCLFVIVQVSSTGYVSFFGRSMFRVVTGSMEPSIPSGALLVSKKVEFNSIKVDDIICFKSLEKNMFGQIITHRVVEKTVGENGIALITKGDANTVTDIYSVTPQNFVGIVTWHSGDGSFVAALVSAVTTRVGFFSLIIIPIVLVSSFILRENMKKIKHQLDEAVKELDAREKSNKYNSSEKCISDEEYIEIYNKVKADLVEELNSNADQIADQTTENSKTEYKEESSDSV